MVDEGHNLESALLAKIPKILREEWVEYLVLIGDIHFVKCMGGLFSLKVVASPLYNNVFVEDAKTTLRWYHFNATEHRNATFDQTENK